MTIEEIDDLLSVVAGYDQRTVGDGDSEAWRLALEDPRVPNISLSECVDAVVLHYRDTNERIGVSHILKRVKAQRAEALTRALPAAKPSRVAESRIKQLLAGRSKGARGECAANRTAVLAHPDLAARLCEQPIGYARPEQWNGFIPPELSDGSHNGSARREALVELVEQARTREAETPREETA